MVQVNLRKLENILTSEAFWLMYSSTEGNPPQVWYLEVQQVKKWDLNWSEHDLLGSMMRAMVDRAYTENRGEEIEFIYPTDKDPVLDLEDGTPKLDADGNPKYYPAPSLFIDEPGKGQWVQYFPPGVKNDQPAINQYVVDCPKDDSNIHWKRLIERGTTIREILYSKGAKLVKENS